MRATILTRALFRVLVLLAFMAWRFAEALCCLLTAAILIQVAANLEAHGHETRALFLLAAAAAAGWLGLDISERTGQQIRAELDVFRGRKRNRLR